MLSKSGKILERTFRHWRDRYSVAGQSIDSRLKRPGIAWQNLRASAALLAEWFRINLRHGWLGSHQRRNVSSPYVLAARGRLERLLESRFATGLELPYGPAALAAGLASDSDPPGPRGRPDPRARGSVRTQSGPIPF